MAYNIKSGGPHPKSSLPYLPLNGKLKTGRAIIFDWYTESDVTELYKIFKPIIDEGQTYPQESMDTIEEFRSYYLSHDAFVIRDSANAQVLGAFYVKPNYPGRSSHICNAGFIVNELCRGQGIATYLVPRFLRVAHDLGYHASMFNLVYITNTASIKLWDSFGFQKIGIVPKAGNLKGLGYVDAIQYYYDLTKLPPCFTDNI